MSTFFRAFHSLRRLGGSLPGHHFAAVAAAAAALAIPATRFEEAQPEEASPGVDASSFASSLVGDGFKRIDEEFLKSRPSLVTNNVVHDTLANISGGLERQEIYFNPVSKELVAILRFGYRTVGWPRIVHGGMAALLFDNCFGWCFFNMGYTKGYTAYLHVNYRSPLLYTVGDVQLRCSMTDKEGRKHFLKGRLLSLDGETIFSDAEALFVIPKVATAIKD